MKTILLTLVSAGCVSTADVSAQSASPKPARAESAAPGPGSVGVRTPAAEFLSYPQLRPLPKPSDRPMPATAARFVDPVNGNDSQAGSREQPWKTLGHALPQLKAGDTLYLRGGTYWEHVTASPKGTAGAPITVRSYPGELAILDGGYREFFEDPANAWEVVSDGGEGEYRSKNSYPGSRVGGNFGDSMVPLRMYGSFVDLRSNKEHEDAKQQSGEGVYVGPGVKRDDATDRIHIRLRHTTLKGLGDENYRGETDPRKLKLVITGSETALEIKDAREFHLQDLVIRGSATAIQISDCAGVEFDGVTVYAVRHGMIITATRGLKVIHSAFRGFAAPWHPRASGTDVDCFCPLDLVTAESGGDIEFAYNEFTDHHDCIEIGDVELLEFHHNLVERFNDDGIDMDVGRLGRHYIHENRISRCLTPLSIHRGSISSDDTRGFYFYRNVIDLRRGTYSHPPATVDEPNNDGSESVFNRSARLIGDHGNPVWPPIFFYHNTVLENHPSWRAYSGSGVGNLGLKQTHRRVFNNAFVHHQLFGAKSKGFVVPQKPAEVLLQFDGNLFWGLEDGTNAGDDYFASFRKSKVFEGSKDQYVPGWSAHDVVVDPKFNGLSTDLQKPTDLTLQQDSPAVNAGIAIPAKWPDSFREQDGEAPDIGAVPFGTKPWGIGIHGKLSLFP